MRLDIVTLFPGMCRAPFEESILKRAQGQGIVEVRLINPRDFARDRHRTVDDKPYGGGAGMVLQCGPLFEAVESVRTPAAHVVLLTPQGESFAQATARRLAECPHLILVCGHYEGVDERARQVLCDEELSIGDYILTNGTLAALVVADAVIRLLPGALGCADSATEESFGDGSLLEYPQYTRPAEFQSMGIPSRLLSGAHEEIRDWRTEQRLVRTVSRRPDLLQRGVETDHEQDRKNPT
ncbi:MAG: tRNA (guanosine(37)-N1)-methyltransferase TrmD [Lentisphaerae bacterium RIFOXYB12_FULL_65_16]|nr:MAG: tRNA (guanosine(37)-N1)-methyltransferase TrmD [Lentisphaerae bacterium RIFOXYA12_64_32]OGV92934.1 MAG: tRNA (guanosine(37)-N1)-methyltransferase TrmD [Lentisphaerae bacterium RIFOXYB12_FULL_65_16]